MAALNIHEEPPICRTVVYSIINRIKNGKWKLNDVRTPGGTPNPNDLPLILSDITRIPSSLAFYSGLIIPFPESYW